jgi:hypothetical protein
MPNKSTPSECTGPMGMQPQEHGGATAPTQMLPLMPAPKGAAERAVEGEADKPAPARKPRTRTDAVRAALAQIARRNSLRKQRNAQKS